MGQEGCKSKVVGLVWPRVWFFHWRIFFKSGWRGFESALIESRRKCFLFQFAENICIFHFSFNFGAVVARCTYPFCTPGLARASTLVCHIPIFQNIKTKQEAKKFRKTRTCEGHTCARVHILFLLFRTSIIQDRRLKGLKLQNITCKNKKEANEFKFRHRRHFVFN